MDDVFCALCGVCFDVYAELYDGRVRADDVSWTAFCRAVRPRKHSTWSFEPSPEVSWYLSGIGQIDGSLGWRGHLPEPGRDVREEEQFADQSYPPPAPPPDNVVPFRSLGKESEIVYPMHHACWNIFCQQYAIIATHNSSTPDLDDLGTVLAAQQVEGEGRGLQPDWTTDYAGAENFWGDGWSWTEDPETSEVKELLGETPDLDFIVFDPENSSSLNTLLQDPPLLSTQSEHGSLLLPGKQEVFAKLPVEILHTTLCFLPTPSIRALRLASRFMALLPLPNTFWRSRFDFPHELCHIPTQDLSSSHTPGHPVDWKALRERLLKARPRKRKHWQNRRRISALTKKLVIRILSSIAVSQNSETPTPEKPSICRQSFPCGTQPFYNQESIEFEPRAHGSEPRSISFSFQSRKYKPLITGIAWSEVAGISTLGRYNEKTARRVDIGPEDCLRGFIIGVAAEGLVGIRVVIGLSEPKVPLREHDFGAFEDDVALGRLFPRPGSLMVGLQTEHSKNGRITSIGLLEGAEAASKTAKEAQGSLDLGLLWYPELPSIKLDVTSAIGTSPKEPFSYMRPTVFAIEPQSLSHVWSVNCFVSPRLQGIDGLQFNFDDREPEPARVPVQGRDIPFLIDGIGGEDLVSIDVLWSRRTSHLWTNRGRRGVFATADVLDEVEIQRLQAPSGRWIGGLYGEVAPDAVTREAYRSFGLFLGPDLKSASEISASQADDTRVFDDHLNVWIEGVSPPADYVIGHTIGHQSSCGFINYVDFSFPILRITACLGSRKGGASSSASDFVGLKIDVLDRPSTLLGRCMRLGPTIEFDEGDRIVEVHVGLKKDGKADVVHEIIFQSRQGMRKGFRDSKVVFDNTTVEPMKFYSSKEIILVGMTWAFDFDFSPTGNHGIQPLYRANAAPGSTSAVQTTHSPLPWAKAPPPGLRLRPFPVVKDIRGSLASSLSSTDNPSDYPDTEIISLQVFFNSILQGIKVHYRNGQARATGSLIGATETIQLNQERIFAVTMRERRQQIIHSDHSSGDILCIEGLQIGLVKWQNGRAEVRYSPWIGSPEPFGPFMNQQTGLFHPQSGGSAGWAGCFPSYTNRILLHPGTSFAGFYAESTPTLIRILGVLVGNHEPLPPEVLALQAPPNFPRQENERLNPEPSSSPVWLGSPPSEAYRLSDSVGFKKGVYRMWCPIPKNLYKILIYRHQIWDRLHIAGMEFSGRNGQDEVNTVLGFRSLWVEHVIVIELDKEEKIKGIAAHNIVSRDGITVFSGLEMITTRHAFASDKTSDNGEKPVLVQSTADVVGFYCLVDEFIEAIGFVLDDQHGAQAATECEENRVES